MSSLEALNFFLLALSGIERVCALHTSAAFRSFGKSEVTPDKKRKSGGGSQQTAKKKEESGRHEVMCC